MLSEACEGGELKGVRGASKSNNGRRVEEADLERKERDKKWMKGEIEKKKYKQMDRDTGPLRNLVRGLLLDL